MSLAMRVSPDTTQEEIEQAASEEWEMRVGFATKFPSVIESNGSYSMKRIVESTDDKVAPPPLEEDEAVGLKAMAHLPISHTSSGSADDLRGWALDAGVPPTTDLLTRWTIKFGNQVTQIHAPENIPVEEVCDRAALNLGLGLKKWTIKAQRRPAQIMVWCSSPVPLAIQASIHFGNQEWAGKANRTYTDPQLVREAQAQLGLEGKWTVRVGTMAGDVRLVEAERGRHRFSGATEGCGGSTRLSWD
jgi:hypothetical protein